MSPDRALLAVTGLSKSFVVGRSALGRPRDHVRAVRDVSFKVDAGRTLGIVGESGSGKSTLGRVALRVLEADAGQIEFAGQDLRALSATELRRARRDMTMIFQDPYSSLNPRWPVGRLVGEPLRVNDPHGRDERRDLVVAALARVGLAEDTMTRLPQAFSGGQRQRIVIARALVTRPRLVFCDEPVSALDVSTRAQVLRLLRDLQAENNLAYLFVSHDLGVVERVSDDIAVMYLGAVVEVGAAESVAGRYRHPYTAALVSAAPAPDPLAQRERRRVPLSGDAPSPINVPSGCPFHPRCPLAIDRCATEVPTLVPDPDGHAVACHVTNADPHLSGPALLERISPPGHTARPTPPRLPMIERTTS
jgi:peptide/nickel transport system ATP-binding protein/oligopeptide transport system ATP-binding protein